MGRAVVRRSAAITASPTGPQPITIGASSGWMRAMFAAWSPTAMGSVSAARSVESASGTASSRDSVSSMYSA